jgi:hypothetical protein
MVVFGVAAGVKDLGPLGGGKAVLDTRHGRRKVRVQAIKAYAGLFAPSHGVPRSTTVLT